MTANPYHDPLMSAMWEMCVQRDLEAFLAADWSITEDDFDAQGFLGIDSCGSSDPLCWKPAFNSLGAYRAAFEQQAAEFKQKRFRSDPRNAMYRALSLHGFEVAGDRATIVKVFDGELALANGEIETLAWKSIFFLTQLGERWRFNGFVGYLPL